MHFWVLPLSFNAVQQKDGRLIYIIYVPWFTWGAPPSFYLIIQAPGPSEAAVNFSLYTDLSFCPLKQY